MPVDEGVWLVVLRFPLEGVVLPAVTQLASEGTLGAYLLRVQRGDVVLEDWPWQTRTAPASTEDPVDWLVRHTRVSVGCFAESSLVQCVDQAPDGAVVAWYLFDGVYVRAHPEAVDPEHLAILHGTVAAKIFDDGVVVLDREGLAASLRWRGVEAPGIRLTRAGGRRREPPRQVRCSGGR